MSTDPVSDDPVSDDDIAGTVLTLALHHASLGTPRPPVGGDAALADLGLDSLTVVRLMVDIESKLGVRFPSEMIDAETFRTVGTIADAVRALRAGSST
jgi:acyl carrier protein